MRDIRTAGIGCLVALVLGCTGVGVALHAQVVPTFTWHVALNSQARLLIHNGSVSNCPPGLQDGCTGITPRHAFYIHYVTNGADRVLLSIPTTAP
jgi:hypothetical protein